MKEEKKIQASEMMYLRRIFNTTKQFRIRNTHN